MADLSLREAVDQFKVSIASRPERSRTVHGVTLDRLVAAYPKSALSEFEPPEGTARALAVLDDAWGSSKPRTYNRNVSFFRTFFAWHTARGNLARDPGLALERKEAESAPRSVFTRDEVDRIIRANSENSDVHDGVPLRLLFAVGIEKATLRMLRFGDFNDRTSEIRFTLRGSRPYPLRVDDDALWADFHRLREARRARDDDFVFATTRARVKNPTAAEIAEMKEIGSIDVGRNYLRQRHDGVWERVTINPKTARGDHGAQIWWYRCLVIAGIVPPGTKTEQSMSKARLTVSRRLFAEGGMREVQRVLGIASVHISTQGQVHTNRDADQLDRAIRHLRGQLRPDTASDRWWKEPVAALTEYVAAERNLVELSRVSFEMLGSQDPSSPELQDAAATLIRAVRPVEIVENAKKESSGQHALLHGHSLVATWSAMETMAADVASAWLANRGPSKGPNRPKVRGVERFERVLEPVGLSGSCDPVLAQNIFEMQQMRHVFAHQGGRADHTFAIKECPHLGYAVGDRILIDRDMWSDVLVNALLYATLVLERMKRRLGVAMTAMTVAPPRPRPIRYV